MNRNLLTMALLICGLSVNGQKKIDYVDPLIGTNGMGHTFPGACVPHGLVQLSPDTDTIPHNITEPINRGYTSIVPAISTGIVLL